MKMAKVIENERMKLEVSLPLSRKFDVTSLDFSLKMLLQLETRKEDLKKRCLF